MIQGIGIDSVDKIRVSEIFSKYGERFQEKILSHDERKEIVMKLTDSSKIRYLSNNFAGLYNEVGCLILTRNSTDQINHIHHRQPLLLEDNEIYRYLEGENILNSSANNNIKFHRVSSKVNSSEINNSSLINKVNF